MVQCDVIDCKYNTREYNGFCKLEPCDIKLSKVATCLTCIADIDYLHSTWIYEKGGELIPGHKRELTPEMMSNLEE